MSLHHMLRAAAGQNNSPTPPASTDPQFNYVSMLLHGDGTNGSQNNTFVDGSTNNFTITRNGNTTQGSLSPYGSLWSNYFDGNGDYLEVPDNSAFSFGSGDFTIEAWIYPTAYAAQDNDGNYIAAIYTHNQSSPVNSKSVLFYLQGTASSYTKIAFNGSSSNTTSTLIEGNYTFALNTWAHVAVVRNGNNIYLYVNGTQVNSTTAFTLTLQDSTVTPKIGAAMLYSGYNYFWYFPGYMSNVRVVKGTAVYTAAFTPPTAPLTAITNTALLTCQSNRFIDNSANNFTITRNGDVRVTKESPFLPTAAYSTSTIGGSGYFDGSGDWLQVSDNAALQFGSGDFTIEHWLNVTSISGTSIISCRHSNTTGTWIIYRNGANLQFYCSSNGSTWDICSGVTIGSVTVNAWNHVAVTRSGTSIRCFLNGVVGSTTTSSATLYSGSVPIVLGANNASADFYTGYISDFRLVKGTAVYTAAFTPPTAPLTAITNTSLLLNFTNAGIFDNAAENVLETVGNAQISTSVKKYGTGSIAFDGSGDRILVPGNQNLRLGSGNFTIEMWLYVNATSDMQIINTADSANYSYAIYKAGTNLGFYLSSNGTSWNLVSGNTFGTVNTGTWYHVALVRNGSTVTPYLNGVAGTSATVTAALADFAVLGIGDSTQSTPGASALNGYIDDLRITKGYARYTANFTPPTAAFPDQ